MHYDAWGPIDVCRAAVPRWTPRPGENHAGSGNGGDHDWIFRHVDWLRLFLRARPLREMEDGIDGYAGGERTDDGVFALRTVVPGEVLR